MRVFFIGFGRALAPGGLVLFLAGVFASSVDTLTAGGILFVLGILAWLTPLRGEPFGLLTIIGASAAIGGYIGLIAAPLTVSLLSISRVSVNWICFMVIIAGIVLFIIGVVRQRKNI